MTSHKPMPITEEFADWIKVSSAREVGLMTIYLVRHWKGDSVVPDQSTDATFRALFMVFSKQLDRIKKGEM